jgi:hypothetical protein
MKTIFKKVIIPFWVLSITFTIFGCKKLDIEKELRIDIGTQFNNDYVSIKLDDNEVFSGNVSTNSLLGVGEILIFDYPIGRYELTVNINGIETKEKFRHKKNRFVYISFDKASSEITIIYPDEKYVYD